MLALTKADTKPIDTLNQDDLSSQQSSPYPDLKRADGQISHETFLCELVCGPDCHSYAFFVPKADSNINYDTEGYLVRIPPPRWRPKNSFQTTFVNYFYTLHTTLAYLQRTLLCDQDSQLLMKGILLAFHGQLRFRHRTVFPIVCAVPRYTHLRSRKSTSISFRLMAHSNSSRWTFWDRYLKRRREHVLSW